MQSSDIQHFGQAALLELRRGASMKKYSRVEVITEKGREYVSWFEHFVEEQDGGRTLKIFKTFPEKKTEVR